MSLGLLQSADLYLRLGSSFCSSYYSGQDLKKNEVTRKSADTL